jgi:alkylation response protein AidB-like acyl-CoA dehydrogenase
VRTPEREEFETCVREWFESNAPKKGSTDDFSDVHVVSASMPEEYEARERHAVDVTRRWQRGLYDAGLAGRSWPAEYGGHGEPAWQDDVIAAVQARFGVSTKVFAVALEMLPAVRQLVAAAVIRERVLDLLGARMTVPGAVPAGGSASKLLYSDHARLTADAATRILGLASTVTDHHEAAPWVERLLFAPGLRIGGGTDEIQRNTIGEQGLGLPREPKPVARV